MSFNRLDARARMDDDARRMSDFFSFDNGHAGFEDLGVRNGTHTWHEADLMRVLGYQTEKSFRAVVTRAMQACLSLGARTEENFISDSGAYKLTRFACYLVAMNGDPKKPEVAAAQVYFAALAETFQSYLEHTDGIDRVLIRDEMKSGMKSLASTAKGFGVENFAYFQNAGYRGMYNMDLTTLAKFKGAKKGTLLDRMGKTELAANLFRVTQTDEKIKNERLRGQRQLEVAAHTVGRTVRNTMKELSGREPEHLPLATPIQQVKRALKGASKKLHDIDAPKKTIKRLPPKPAGGNQ